MFQIVPVVEKVFPFSDLPAAYEKVAAKHNRGKTVLDLKDDLQASPQSAENRNNPSATGTS